MSYDYRRSFSRSSEPKEPATLKGPHPDYENNLKIAENFCKKVDQKMPLGMRVYVTGSPELPKSLMFVSWKPPKEHYAGFCATPIFLHDSTSNVNKKIEGIFNTYMKRAQEICDKYPAQPSLDGFGCNDWVPKV